jgi:hypothetical protein
VKKLIFSLLLFGLLSPVYAGDNYQDLMKDFKRVYVQLLEKKVAKIPKETTVEVFLKDGTSIKGYFKGYYSYDGNLWIRPLNRWGLFSNEVYDIKQVQDVSIIILRSI